MKNKKRIAIVGTNGLPGRYGGWDQLLNHLTQHLSNQYDITVYCSINNAVKGLDEYNGAKLKVIPLKANGIQSIPYDILSMIHATFKRSDIILVLGTSGCMFLPFLKPFCRSIVLNPDGAEWKRGKWNSFIKKFLKNSESFGVRFSDAVVSDNVIIQRYVRNEYKKDSSLIAYGGDNVKFVELKSETADKYGIQKGSYAFKVCRIVPENNIEMILSAFSETDYRLVMIGNWNFSEFGKRLRIKHKDHSNLLLLDPIYDQETLDELRGNCGIYVHGHSVGGTNPSLVEAMSLGLFCVTYDVDYNRETTYNKTVYFSSHKDLLRLLTDSSIDRKKICDDLLAVARKHYTWHHVTEQYNNVFRSLDNH